jgi:CHASE2 domain-containing sensor protein
MRGLKLEDATLDHPQDALPPEGPLAEWTGLFLFAVGAFGTIYRPYTRHLTLWGLLPLDWFYTALLLGGAVLMLWGSSWSPFHPAQAAQTPLGLAVLRARQAFSLLVLALLFWLTVLR